MVSKDVLTQVVSKLSYPIIIADNEGNFEFLNAKASDILKLPKDFADKSTWENFFVVKDLQDELILIDNYPIMKALRGEEVKGDKIILSNTQDQSKTYITVDSFPLYGEDKRQIGAVVVMNDISDKVKLENILKEVGEKLDKIKDHLESTLHPNYIV